jgi:putative transposase
MTSKDVSNRLCGLLVIYGISECIRSDNGPEFVATVIPQRPSSLEVRTLYVAPGSSWKKDYAESFQSPLRDQLLAIEKFDSLRHARVHSSARRRQRLPSAQFAWRLTSEHVRAMLC